MAAIFGQFPANFRFSGALCLRWQNSAKPKIFVNGIRAICYIFPACSSLAITVWEWRCSEDIFTKDEGLSQWITKMFVEQPRIHQVC